MSAFGVEQYGEQVIVLNLLNLLQEKSWKTITNLKAERDISRLINPIYTKSGILLANGYSRIVYGERGAYIELTKAQIIQENIHIPLNAKWRLSEEWKDRVYYIEYRADDNVKVYYQKQIVGYADYKIGFYYISIDKCIIENASINKFL